MALENISNAGRGALFADTGRTDLFTPFWACGILPRLVCASVAPVPARTNQYILMESTCARIALPVVFRRIQWVLTHAVCEAQVTQCTACRMPSLTDGRVIAGNLEYVVKRRCSSVERIACRSHVENGFGSASKTEVHKGE